MNAAHNDTDGTVHADEHLSTNSAAVSSTGVMLRSSGAEHGLRLFTTQSSYYTSLNSELSTMHNFLFTIHYSLFTIHYSLLTIHYSLFTIHYSLFTIAYF